MNAEVHIFDIAASVSLNQTYKNDAFDAVEVRYLFPIPARSVVNGFCLIGEDGRKTLGLVEEQASGKAMYEAAIEEGKSASFMEEIAPDGTSSPQVHIFLVSNNMP